MLIKKLICLAAAAVLTISSIGAANQMVTAATSAPGTSSKSQVTVDYSAVKDTLHFNDLSFEIDVHLTMTQLIYTDPSKLSSFDMIDLSQNSTNPSSLDENTVITPNIDFSSDEASEPSMVIDDISKKLTLNYDNKVYVFPYVSIHNYTSAVIISTPNGLLIGFDSFFIDTQYISSIKPLSLTPQVFKNTSYFSDYKEAPVKAFAKTGTLNDDFIKKLLCYVYLNDKPNFDDWLSDEADSINFIHEEISKNNTNSAAYSSFNKIFDSLTQCCSSFGIGILTFTNKDNYDEDGYFTKEAFDKLRTQLLNYLKKDTKAKNTITSTINNIKTKVVHVNCPGTLVDDNGFGFYANIKDTYISLNDENNKNNIINVKINNNGDDIVRIDNPKTQEIWIITFKE